MSRMLPALIASLAIVAAGASPALAKRFKHIDHVVVVFEENHSFDNLYGGWEGVDGLDNAPAGPHDAGRPERRRLHLPQAERPEPDVADAARPDVYGLDDGHDVRERVHQPAVHDRRLHLARCDNVPQRHAGRRAR